MTLLFFDAAVEEAVVKCIFGYGKHEKIIKVS